MGFLRRLLGGGGSSAPPASDPAASPAAPTGAAADEAAERAYELDLLREEHARLDELAQRQLRYADRAWQPPAQGGERRADDRDREPGDR